ncbi:hypothetical protein AB833_17280 [Chromatiales bacterium (ex Bugula neritina AB1)]|nr:hypothetical protein AB833_17280 [Chromatiales bacterium (ex Bugula neritina AB1)]
MPVIDVTAAVFLCDGRVLSFRRKPGQTLAGYWEFPGGKLELNETLAECLQREIREELAVQITVGDYLGVTDHSGNRKKIRLHGYIVSQWSGEIQLTDHDRMLWLGAAEIDTIQWLPADEFFVERIRQHLR